MRKIFIYGDGVKKNCTKYGFQIFSFRLVMNAADFFSIFDLFQIIIMDLNRAARIFVNDEEANLTLKVLGAFGDRGASPLQFVGT